ncbi:hypothetical protein DNTS_011728 [Danionella cerebrum]|uniref:Nanos-type domain-containing protein n=1 Tax=Danionella cerebrum TaxID=2873325 RepID=A0A553P196_9TELE|nr:hypothetical protein DNTS_011728 [Danionella translucida]
MERERENKPGLGNEGYFMMWRDYMGLRRTVTELQRANKSEEERVDAPPVAAPPFAAERPVRSWSCGSSGAFSTSSSSSSSSREGCGFCRQNGETIEVYQSHRLRGMDGRLICPVLRCYVCPICSATGDHAHTRQYCPRRKTAKE